MAQGEQAQERQQGPGVIQVVLQVAAMAFLVNQFSGGSLFGGAKPGDKAKPAELDVQQQQRQMVDEFGDPISAPKGDARPLSTPLPAKPAQENMITSMFGMVFAPPVHEDLADFQAQRKSRLDRVSRAVAPRHRAHQRPRFAPTSHIRVPNVRVPVRSFRPMPSCASSGPRGTALTCTSS